MSASRIISLLSSPAPSAKRIPVSETKATSHLRSSSIIAALVLDFQDIFYRYGKPFAYSSRFIKVHPYKWVLKIKRILRDGEVKDGSNGTDYSAHARANQTLSNQVIPITQSVCSGVLSQGLGSTGIHQDKYRLFGQRLQSSLAYQHPSA